MAEEITRLSAALAERMRELRADPTDPRLAPLCAIAGAGASACAVRPAMRPTCRQQYSFDLPAELDDLLRGYLETCPPQAFKQAPALTESDAGRRILALAAGRPGADGGRGLSRLELAHWGGPNGAGLRRVVSDLLRAKLPLTDADAVALVDRRARRLHLCELFAKPGGSRRARTPRGRARRQP